MFGALIAVVMIGVWIAYIAFTVLALAEGGLTEFGGWIVATPLVFGLEALAWRGLERFAKPA